jgi:hypothetical protein
MAVGDRMHPDLARELRSLAAAADLTYADVARHLWAAAGWIGAVAPSYSTVRALVVRERRRLARTRRARLALAAAAGGGAATLVLLVVGARVRVDHHEPARPRSLRLSRSAFP